MDFLPFTVTASGNPMRQPAQGRYVRYLSNSTGFRSPAIEVRGDKGGRMLLLPGQSGLLNKSIGFESLEVRNYNNVADITGVLAVGDVEEFQDDSRVSGVVSVVGGEASDVLAGREFVGSGHVVAVGANYSYAQFWNPADSGVDAVINQAVHVLQAIDQCEMRVVSAEIAAGAACANRLIGGAASACKVKVGVTASVTGDVIDRVIKLSNTPHKWMDRMPVVVPPGSGIVIQTVAVNITMAGSFHFSERSYASR